MRTVIAVSCIVFGLFSCNQNTVSKSELNSLINNQLDANEEILREMRKFTETHGEKGFESQLSLVDDFQRIHDRLNSFLHSIDSLEDKSLGSISNDFIQKNFFYKLTIPQRVFMTETTPGELIKLQLVNLENLMLREYKDGVNFRFNAMEAVIIPDKIEFKNNEPVTGTISMIAYSTELEINAKVNGIDVKGSGKVPFTIDPTTLKEKQKLTVEIFFPDKIYNASIDLTQK